MRLKIKSTIGLFLTAWCALPAVQAAPVGYSIDFLATFAGNDATGTFTYDANVGLFTDFLVNWEGHTLDLTNAANNPLIGNGSPSCLGGSVGGAATFEAIAGACGPGDDPFWTANTFFGNYDFTFLISDGPGGAFLRVNVLGPPTADVFGAGGVWEVTQAESDVPEPTSLALALSGLCGLALLAARRRAARPMANQREDASSIIMS